VRSREIKGFPLRCAPRRALVAADALRSITGYLAWSLGPMLGKG
jgi:hypothetical protein